MQCIPYWTTLSFAMITQYTLVVLVLGIHLLDSAIHLINHYALDNLIAFSGTYLMDSDLSAG